jgi:hypothetical protein
MTRVRLPDRRPSFTTVLVYENNPYSVTLGFDVRADRIAEVFTHGAKVGSGMDRLLDDVCVALSLCCSMGPNRGRSPPAWAGSATASRRPPSSARSRT